MAIKSKRIEEIGKKKIVQDSIFIFLGALLQAVGYSLFVAPASIVPGGVYGISIAINHLTKNVFSFFPDGLPIGATALLFNIPLFLLATKKLGLSSGGKTIATFFLTSLFTDLIGQITQRQPLVENDLILASVYGGAILGLGVLFTFKAGSTSAGTDVVARIIAKGNNIRINKALLLTDSLVVLFGLIAFGDWKIPLYSLITLFVFSSVVGMLQPENPNKAIFIISNDLEGIRNAVKQLNLRGTIIHGQGMYAGVEREVFFIFAERKHLPRLRKRILEVDPSAFISTMNASIDTVPRIT